MSVSFRCLSLLLGPTSQASGKVDQVGKVISGGVDSLAPVPSHASISLLQTRGPISSLVLGDDSMTDSAGHSALDKLWASSIGLKGNFLKPSCGPCEWAAIRPFGYHTGTFPVLHPQWFCLISRCGLVDCLLLEYYRVSHLYVRRFDIPFVVCILFHLLFLPKIPLEEFFKVMLRRKNLWEARDTSDLLEHFSGAMRSHSVGTKESVYHLLEIRYCQLAYLVQLLQYSHELLSLCIGLWIQCFAHEEGSSTCLR